MSLHDYQRKRDFSRTREPGPGTPAPAGARAIFVVQLHHARRRHYDFRLQVGDALKSWAVPKGPSYDPAVKRLAVEVEDHPVSYADFEGDIEEGYGQGHVDLFDRGVWATDGDAEAQLEKGHLGFELFGRRLKGRWHLVRSGRRERKPSWFLIKDGDAFAGKLEADDLLDARLVASTRRATRSGGAREVAEKLAAGRRRAAPKGATVALAPLRRRAAGIPGARKAAIDTAFFAPELTRLRETPPHGEGWLHEIKWDGYRILAAIAGGAVQLWSRNALDWNARAPELVQALEQLGLREARLDGELIALHAGRSDFNALQQTLAGEAQAPLVYMLFDLPHFEGWDLRRSPLRERKALLEALIPPGSGHLAFSRHYEEDGEAVFAMVTAQGLEGIVSKRADSGYRPGRGDDWVKVKRLESDEFAVVGYTPPKGRRSGFGSLLLARPDAGGGWRYAGRVGSGFSDAQLRELGAAFAGKGRRTPPVRVDAIDPLLRQAYWVHPSLVAEVYYRGIGNQGLLRQPSLKTLRDDKMPNELRDADRPAPATVSRAAARGSGTPVRLTHPERVVYPGEGITKQDVFDYYAAVMEWFLPGVQDRPTSVLRCPDGVDGECFFQKHFTRGLKHVGMVKLKEESGAQAVYIYPRETDSVLELAQFGVIEFHPWGATVAEPDRADRVVFDLDPGPGVGWDRVKAAARQVRKQLDRLGLQSFLRTTGGKGMHVVVPLAPACAWLAVKAFAHAFADTLAQLHPLEFVAVAAKSQRGGRIFIDYLRNSRGATSIASYSLRARPGAPVAMPLRWSELGALASGRAFDLRTAPKRLARLRSDPWEEMGEIRQNLDEVLERLERGQASE
ncbi:DNA ligase D [Frateuria defendens]|uniref:DNA ligase D n=1 Tax=Frateuria defendens TaxID=2219559 RepID=UPI00066FBF96|nr:DNA ligase D [Frateuria defendens]